MPGHTQDFSMSSTVVGGGSAFSPTSNEFAKSAANGTSDSPMPPVIPPEHDGRTLVLCFDGTGDQFDADNSNIIQLFSMLKKNDRKKQMVYYQAGIGTYTCPEIATPFWAGVSKKIDMMVASNLDVHVMQGYEFLMKNYTDGDRICIFGFSRGSYTARALAGMLHKVGLLPADNLQQVPFAYKMYTTTDKAGWEQSNAFKRTFSNDVDIHFVGVWDTVDSVGIIPRRLPFATSNAIIKTFRHAVSLDERRAYFKANLWNYPTPEELQLGIVKGTHSQRILSEMGYRDNADARMYANEAHYSSIRKEPSDVYEVWFAGCHTDIGGGSVKNGTPHNLARISLRWMIRETFKTNSGIMFDSQALKQIGLNPATLYPKVLERPPPITPESLNIPRSPPTQSLWSRLFYSPTRLSVEQSLSLFSRKHADGPAHEEVHDAAAALEIGTEEEEDLKDALMPKFDQLSLKWTWWILEIVPLTHRYQTKDDKWHTWFGWNIGRGRYVPRQSTKGVNMHRTVKLRQDSYIDPVTKKHYVPRASCDVEPRYVD